MEFFLYGDVLKCLDFVGSCYIFLLLVGSVSDVSKTLSVFLSKCINLQSLSALSLDLAVFQFERTSVLESQRKYALREYRKAINEYVFCELREYFKVTNFLNIVFLKRQIYFIIYFLEVNTNISLKKPHFLNYDIL